jgi:hypothetical protein
MAIPSDVISLTAMWIAEHVKTHELGRVEVVLHGGEPLPAGVAGLRAIPVELTRALGGLYRLDVRVHTNGMLVEPNAFCSDSKFLRSMRCTSWLAWATLLSPSSIIRSASLCTAPSGTRLVVPELDEAGEAVGAVPAAHVGMGVLQRLRDRGDPPAVKPRPQGGDDGVDAFAAARPVYDLTAGEREPLPGAVVAFKVTPRVERDKYPAVLYRVHEFG